mgnify:CR=1 FL=1
MKYLYLFTSICLFSCGVKFHVTQNLSESNKLSPGMNKQEIISVMGNPIKSDFEKNVEEWFYCKTGSGESDEFVVLFIHNDVLVTKRNYTVTSRDTKGVYGSCEKFIKMGGYSVPNEIKEIRLSY